MSKITIKLKLHIIALFYLFSLTLSAETGQAATAKWTQLEFSPAPWWLSSADWSLDETSILTVDVVQKKIFSYTPGDSLGKVVLEFDKEDLSEPAPSILRQNGDSYLLEREDGRLERWSSDFVKQGTVAELQDFDGPEGKLGALNQWVITGNHFLAYGDIQRPDGSWVSGIIYAPLDRPAEFQLLETINISDPGRTLHLVSNHYLAAFQDKGYFLLMRDKPMLFLVDFPADDADLSWKAIPLPQHLRYRPDVSQFRGFDGVRDLYEAIERSNLLVGVYAVEEGLAHLLQRNSRPDGTSSWSLWSLDITTNKVEFVTRLPTKAPHVQLVASSERWALIEKGTVRALGVQEIYGAKVLKGKAVK